MLILVVLALAGLALLTFAADQLVLGAGRLATRLGIAPVVVGVVVIGLGTSTPEFVVSGLAAARGDAALALGNLTGSNIINVTLILGVVGLVAPIAVRSSVPRREAPLSVVAVALFAGFASARGIRCRPRSTSSSTARRRRGWPRRPSGWSSGSPVPSSARSSWSAARRRRRTGSGSHPR